MKKNKENRERKPLFFATEETGICKQVKIKHKSLLSALILGIIIALFGLFGMTGCKKKTTDNGGSSTNTTTKAPKVYTFDEVFPIYLDEGNVYPSVIRNYTDESNYNLTSNSIIWTAKYKAKIKKISYTVGNTSTENKTVYKIQNNGNWLNSNINTWEVYHTVEGYEKYTVAPNETLEIVATYDNFIVNKGQKWSMTFLMYSEHANFYNFKVEFEVIE